MTLREELKQALVTAAKAKDQVWLDTIRSVQSAIRYKEIEKRGELTDAEIQSVISSLCKQHRESIDQFQKGGREDLVKKEQRELEMLQKYLPAQLSRADVEKIIQKVIDEIKPAGPQDLGRVMKGAMKDLSSKADGALVSEIVRSLLK